MLKRLLRTEPVLLTGVVAGVLSVAVAFGVGLEPEQVAALVALIGACVAFARGVVYAPATVVNLVHEAARTTAVALDPVTAGPAGTITGAAESVIGRVVNTVTGSRYNPPPERGGIPLAALIALGLGLLVLAGGFVVCDALIDDEDEPNDLGMPALVLDHDGDDYDQRYGSEDDRNRNRDRDRGAFSPGPFDRSPIDFSGSCFSLDCSGQDERRRREDETPER